MNKNQNTKDDMCMVYASDYHFEMIAIPYIQNEMEKEKLVFILTENDLKNTVEKVVSRVNLEQDKKSKILELDWENDNNKKIKKIQKMQSESVIIFIKGKKKFVSDIHNCLRNEIEQNEGIEIVDCYDILDISSDLKDIVKKYKNVLNSIGKKVIGNI